MMIFWFGSMLFLIMNRLWILEGFGEFMKKTAHYF